MDEDLNNAGKEIPANHSGPFSILTFDIRRALFKKFLSDQELGRLARVSTFFNRDLKAESFWIDKLIQLGCDANLLAKLKDTNAISNYKQLYRNVKSFFDKNQIYLSAVWELLCLSGELNAVGYGLVSGEINQGRTDLSYKPIHYLAFAGQVEALKLLKQFQNADLNALSKRFGYNILHMAARGNSPAAMQYALDLGISKHSTDAFGRDALYLACACGARESTLFALNVLKLDKDKRDYSGFNALLTAIVIHNKRGVHLALSILNHPPNSWRGIHSRPNALHLAAQFCDMDMLKFVHTELKISYTSEDMTSNTILHYAAANSPEMMQFIVDEVGIHPDLKNDRGERALHSAARGKNPLCIKFSVANLGISLYSECFAAYTPMWPAIMNRNKNIIIALREAGYDPNHRDSKNRSAFDYLSAEHGLSLEQTAALKEALTCNIQLDKTLYPSGEQEGPGKRALKR